MGRVTVPPILSRAAISLSALRRPLVARRVLPGLPRGCDASERGGPDVALRLPPMSPPHAPCSPSAGAVAWPPASLPTPLVSYTNRFSPYLSLCGPSAGMLAVAVLRHAQVTPRVPPLAVSRGGLPRNGGRGVGKFLWGITPAAAYHAPSSHLLYHGLHSFKARRTTAPRRRAPSSNSAGASRLKARRR